MEARHVRNVSYSGTAPRFVGGKLYYSVCCSGSYGKVVLYRCKASGAKHVKLSDPWAKGMWTSQGTSWREVWT